MRKGWVLLCLLLAAPVWAQELAFPGAEGFGRYTQGGRGGQTIDVTNLNDSGPGSLRQCAEVTSGPRICRLAVNGTAALTNDITIRHPFVTIEPLPGVQFAIKNGGIDVRASQTIMRHFRIRPGNYTYATYGRNANGITYRSTEASENTSHHIADHLSISWGTDDLINVVFGTDNVTVQWSILSEGYVVCGQSCGGKGLLVGYGARNVSFHHNLSAHNWIRWPEYTGGSDVAAGNLDFVNNVHYNGNGTDTIMWSYHGPQFANFIGNYWKQGLDGPATQPLNQGYPAIRTIGQQTYTSSSGIFVQDNYGRYAPVNCPGCQPAIGVAVPHERILWEDNGGIPKASTRYDYPLVTTTSALQAYEDVLNGVGAFPRDSVDTRVLNDVRNGTGHWINDAADVGGWPLLTGGDTTIPPPPSPPTEPPPPPPPTTGYTLTASVTGLTITLPWTAPTNHSVSDWIAVVPTGQPAQAYVAWSYLPAETSGTITLTVPVDGAYDVRLLRNNAWDDVMASVTVTVGVVAPPPPPVEPPPPPPVDPPPPVEETTEQRLQRIEQTIHELFNLWRGH